MAFDVGRRIPTFGTRLRVPLPGVNAPTLSSRMSSTHSRQGWWVSCISNTNLFSRCKHYVTEESNAGDLGAVRGRTVRPHWVQHHVQDGRRPVPDEVSVDLFLCGWVPPATPGCTPVWVEAGVARRTVLDVNRLAQVSVFELYLSNQEFNLLQ